jgi:DNA primase
MRSKIESHFHGKWYDFYSKYLQGVKKIGGQEYQALCPFHQDTKPSFNFNNQKGVYFCHGCGKKGGGFHFYARTHGLSDRGDFVKILKGIASDFGIPWEEQTRQLVKVYDYTDAQGKLVHQTLRYEPKDFKQRRPGYSDEVAMLFRSKAPSNSEGLRHPP